MIFLFLHGFPDTPAVWQAQCEHLATRGTVLAPALNPRASLAEQRQELLAALRGIDATESESVTVVAHDLGVLHAWELAPALGARLAGMFLLNGVAAEQILLRFMRNPKQLLKSWYVFSFQLPFLPERLFPYVAARKLPARDRQELKKAAPLIAHYRAGMRSAPRRLLKPPPPVQAPVWLLASTGDPYLEVPAADELRQLAPRGHIRPVAGGHWLQQEAPERVNALLDDFLATLAIC